MSHFQGKTVPEHLKEARQKGALASSEVHGVEMSGFKGALADAAKESSLYLLFLWLIFYKLSFSNAQIFSILTFFSVGLLLWKTGRSALLGWARLERLHRITEEERWEIEHHRAQEKEELTELYRAKGFEGKQLEEVVEVLMADDNRLLNVMLEEELGLTLEVYDHPLKQAAGAAIGVIAAATLSLALFWLAPPFGLLLGATINLAAFTIFATRQERNRALPATIWNFAAAALAFGILFFVL